MRMGLDPNDVNKHLKPLFEEYEDSFQEAWVEILEQNAQTINEIDPIAKKVRNRAIRQYLNKKYKEESLQRPLGRDGNETFTLESILSTPLPDENADTVGGDDNDNAFYKRMVDFMIGEYLKQKKENLELKKKQVELKAERIRVRKEWLKFRKDRYESWKQLMEDKGRQKEELLRLHVQLQRDKLEFRKEQLRSRKSNRARRLEKQRPR